MLQFADGGSCSQNKSPGPRSSSPRQLPSLVSVSLPRAALMTKHGAICRCVCSEAEEGRGATALSGRRRPRADVISAVCSWFGPKPQDPDLHSQVPEQNRRNLSGLNRTQNHRLQTHTERTWLPFRPHVCCFYTFKQILKRFHSIIKKVLHVLSFKRLFFFSPAQQ